MVYNKFTLANQFVIITSHLVKINTLHVISGADPELSARDSILACLPT